jgi:hypothetical protein
MLFSCYSTVVPVFWCQQHAIWDILGTHALRVLPAPDQEGVWYAGSNFDVEISTPCMELHIYIMDCL